jgi:hypothetical protein
MTDPRKAESKAVYLTQAQNGEALELTPTMISAGVEALKPLSVGNDPTWYLQNAVVKVFHAMMAAVNEKEIKVTPAMARAGTAYFQRSLADRIPDDWLLSEAIVIDIYREMVRAAPDDLDPDVVPLEMYRAARSQCLASADEVLCRPLGQSGVELVIGLRRPLGLRILRQLIECTDRAGLIERALVAEESAVRSDMKNAVSSARTI